MPSGKVKFFDVAKGYGFLVPDDGGPDLFVHNKAVRRAGLKALVPGESLTFEVTQDRGRPEATALARPAPEGAAPARRTITLRPRASKPRPTAERDNKGAAERDNKGLESAERTD